MNLSDLGNAQRLIAIFGLIIRFCKALKMWFHYNGIKWVGDISGALELMAKQVPPALYHEASRTADPAERIEIAKFGVKSENVKGIRNMIESAKSEPMVAILPDQFDTNKYLFNVLNGTIDTRSGKLLPHQPSDYITKVSLVEFNEAMKCTKFLVFLDSIFGGNRDVIRYMQKIIGMSLTGDISERLIFILFGSGANGKSTFIRVITDLLGEYSANINPNALFRHSAGVGPLSAIAGLRGARFITSIEPEEGKKLNESLIKSITGNDWISARYLYGNYFTLQIEGKLFLVTNYKPIIKETLPAIWDRVRLIPFDVTIPADKRDKGLYERLKQELSGILNWALEGCLAWQSEGLETPKAIREATEAYRIDMDPIAGFIRDECEVGEGCEESAGKLYSVYCNCCLRDREKPVSKKMFGMKLQEKGFRPVRTSSERKWEGIGLSKVYAPLSDENWEIP